jgi:hypothetical protein
MVCSVFCALPSLVVLFSLCGSLGRMGIYFDDSPMEWGAGLLQPFKMLVHA